MKKIGIMLTLALFTSFACREEAKSSKMKGIRLQPTTSSDSNLVYTGPKAILPIEGGSIEMQIDTITKLNILIMRLNKNWHFNETGKGYWIGYTNDMFSIAARKNAAIKPLLKFIDTSSNQHARLGAIYTLHLIGINSNIAGRFSEEFSNQEARNALLSALRDSTLQPTIIELLIRDRRHSDIPKIFNAMMSTSSDCWALNNFITQFNLSLPVNQDIPKSFNQSITLNYDRELKTDFEKQLPLIMKLIASAKFENIIVDSELLKINLWGSIITSIIEYSSSFGKMQVNIRGFLYKMTNLDYTNIGNKFMYYLEDNKIHICTQKIAKLRLINWWKNLSEAKKKKIIKANDDKLILFNYR